MNFSAGQPGMGATTGSPKTIGGVKFDQKQIKDAMQNHFQQKVLVVDDVDRQVWELVSNVPLVSKPVAIVAAVMNVLLPWFGTAIAACASEDIVSKGQLTIGLIQFLTSFVLIGWIMSIYWGYLIFMKSQANQGMQNNMMGGKMGNYASQQNSAGIGS